MDVLAFRVCPEFYAFKETLASSVSVAFPEVKREIQLGF